MSLHHTAVHEEHVQELCNYNELIILGEKLRSMEVISAVLILTHEKKFIHKHTNFNEKISTESALLCSAIRLKDHALT